MSRVHVAWGSVSGVLDIVNVRGKTLGVSVCDPSTGRAVSGTVGAGQDPEVRRAARAALGSRVLVGGWIHRNGKGRPVRVEVERIEVLGPAEGAPKLEWGELLGAAPELLEGRTVEQYLGRARSA
jgi:hypothetical protein